MNGILHNIKLNPSMFCTVTQPEPETCCPSALRCKCYYTIQETYLIVNDCQKTLWDTSEDTSEVIHSNLLE